MAFAMGCPLVPDAEPTASPRHAPVQPEGPSGPSQGNAGRRCTRQRPSGVAGVADVGPECQPRIMRAPRMAHTHAGRPTAALGLSFSRAARWTRGRGPTARRRRPSCRSQFLVCARVPQRPFERAIGWAQGARITAHIALSTLRLNLTARQRGPLGIPSGEPRPRPLR
jgi:hypothetical protein